MKPMTKDRAAPRIAKNIAALVDAMAEGPFILNLGVGIPTLVGDYVRNENIFIHAENGMLGVGPLAVGEQVHPQLINAGRQPVTETPGCTYMDSALSFGMIRGGHVDAVVLGAFQVSSRGDLANWIIPGGKQLGVGGAMDLACGAKQVIVAMQHGGAGRSKLVSECTLPVTGRGVVDWVVTEYAMFRFDPDGPVLAGLTPDITVEQLRENTEFSFSVAQKRQEMLI